LDSLVVPIWGAPTRLRRHCLSGSRFRG
jgi:hypothetical protein